MRRRRTSVVNSVFKARVRAKERRRHQIRLPLSALRRATDRFGVRPPKNK